MFHTKRIWATLAYLAMLIVTLGVSLGMPNDNSLKVVLVLVCVFMQMLALTWYTLSYIPFARDAVISMAKSCCKG